MSKFISGPLVEGPPFCVGTSFFRPDGRAHWPPAPLGTGGKEGAPKCPIPACRYQRAQAWCWGPCRVSGRSAQERGQCGHRGAGGPRGRGCGCALLPSLPSGPPRFVLLQAAERDNQDLEDKVRSLKTDVEESRCRERHLKAELRSFLEVLDGKLDDLHDFRRGLSKLGADN